MDDNLPIPFEGSVTEKRQPVAKGGRPKGSKNKKGYLLAQAQREIEQKYGVKGFDPVVFLLMTAADPNNTIEVRITAAVKVAPYIHPTAKPVSMDDGKDKQAKPVDTERLMRRIATDLLIENHVTVPDEPPPEDGEEEPDEENQPPGI